MKKVTSISGGKSSAYIAAHYPADFLLFALVCIEDKKCTPKDKKLVQLVSDKIGKEFIATAEDDTILHTILDLEQYVGQKIEWVAGETFDKVITNKGDWLPNKMARYCTVEMKLRPLHRWWKKNIAEPVEMQIGFRAGEGERAKRMYERLNKDGLLEFKDVVGKHSNGNNKWATIAWQSPSFPMITDGVYRDKIVEFWKDKPVRFAPRNNCVGCFHRNPLLLRTMFDQFPNKMQWFAAQEERSKKGKWQKEMTYQDIKNHKLQHTLSFDDFEECDSGHCGI